MFDLSEATLSMRKNNVDSFLKNFHLRKTSCRVDILNIFLDKGNITVSQSDLEKIIGKKYDRATIYRTLLTFEDSGIIHRVIVQGHGVHFALCDDSCKKNGQHQHEHVHFKCNKCEKTECLNEVSLSELVLPKGYKKESVNYLVFGTCPRCNA